MRTIFITGANGGFGHLLAKRLLELNFFVILNYHKHNENLLPLLEKYSKQTYLIQGDVSCEKSVIHMKKECDSLEFEIDFLINNAAIDHASEMEDKTEETFMNIFKVNTLGVFLMSKIFGSDINQLGGGIINISSDNSIDSYDYITMEYDVSKIGVNMLTYDFAKYYTNTKVNALAFGWLDTPMNIIPEDMKKFIQFFPIERAIQCVIDLFDTIETGKVIVCR